MKILISAILLLSLTGEKFNLLGKWSSEDAHGTHKKHENKNEHQHQHLLEINFMDQENVEIIYPEMQKRSARNQSTKYTVHQTSNDSILHLDIVQTTTKENQQKLVKNGFCKIKFLNPSTIIFSDFADQNDRLVGEGVRFTLKRVDQ